MSYNTKQESKEQYEVISLRVPKHTIAYFKSISDNLQEMNIKTHGKKKRDCGYQPLMSQSLQVMAESSLKKTK